METHVRSSSDEDSALQAAAAQAATALTLALDSSEPDNFESPGGRIRGAFGLGVLACLRCPCFAARILRIPAVVIAASSNLRCQLAVPDGSRFAAMRCAGPAAMASPVP